MVGRGRSPAIQGGDEMSAWAKRIVSVVCLWLVMQGLPTVASADPAPTLLELAVGQAHVLTEPFITRIAVGNGKVVQATALDERQVLLVPEAPGQSSLHVWGRRGLQRTYLVNVVPADSQRLVSEVQSMLGPAGNVRVRAVGDKIMVDGENLNEEQSQRLAEIGKRYPQLMNLISKVGMERMIAMDVRILEINRTALENIGVKWNPQATGPTFGIIGDVHRSNSFQPGGVGETVLPSLVRPKIEPFATVLGLASSVTSVLNFLVQNGDAVVLAEPRLSCRSGGSARFVAGGELPIPVTSGIGSVSVVFREYGVKFEIKPVANDAGVIAAAIATEISSIDPTVSVREVPGLLKRRAETDVNLREGETLVIAGLLSEESAADVDKVAGLGEVPVLGRLFRSRRFRDRQSELIVMITPRFVTPESEGNRKVVEELPRKHEAARDRLRMLD